ncbi:M-factor transporter Mam1 [Schizosaccharomyces cryophilus OY26]|uniref:M-factor transporter Mam1 n=1 Tax=Schizosaccharomyces cryophilus (strain OY26 / ATCC MYA-4695 / CBS 11777 / NBRC 106824 / NRRL Y48691) TaxID=653667 RepID=S9W5K7_SCHCR|nr:M-factor transporter Mam1 [Schizosaccharomyces cryophilus OY26]EPY53839.1 M-factor transporter Mam1 [Schizosaccharomyces cryophilus OY26]
MDLFLLFWTICRHCSYHLLAMETGNLSPNGFISKKDSFKNEKFLVSITEKSIASPTTAQLSASTATSSDSLNSPSHAYRTFLDLPSLDGDDVQSSAYYAHASSWSDYAFAFRFSDALLLFLTLTFTCLSASLEPLMTWTIGKIFDAFSNYARSAISIDEMCSIVNFNSLLICLFGIASWVFSFAVRFYWQYLSAIIGKRSRSLCFHALTSKPSAFYSLINSSSSLINSVDRCVQFYESSINLPLFHIMENLAVVISSLVMSFRYSWSLTLIIMASYPIIMFVVAFINSFLYNSYEGDRLASEKAATIIERVLMAFKTVTFHAMQKYEFQNVQGAIDHSSKFFLRFSFLHSLQGGISQFFLYSVFFQGLWYGNHLANSGKVTAGQVVTVFGSCLSIASAIQQILPSIPDLIKGKFASHFLKSLCHEPFSSKQKPPKVGIQDVSLSWSFNMRNVSFMYPSTEDHKPFSLVNISMSIPSGKVSHIIGPSGSGKSTIATLLMSFFQPTYGYIYIDDVPLAMIDPNYVYSNVTLVRQDAVVFDMTIRENIMIGNHSASNDDFECAVRLALVDEFAWSFDKGYDTPCHEGTLSGGQRQRIALARALLRNTEVLILDEPTSGLDIISKNLVNDAIRAHRLGKTTIYITHDMSHIYDDDWVFFIENGRLLQQGSKRKLRDLGIFSNPSDESNETSSETTILEDPFLENFEKSEETYSAYGDISPSFVDASPIMSVVRNRDPKSHYAAQEKPSDTIDGNNRLFLKEKESIYSVFTIFKSLWKVQNARHLFFLGCLTSLAQGASIPVLAFIVSKSLNLFMHQNMSVGIALWSCLILVVAAFTGLFYFLSHYVFTMAATNWCDHYRLLGIKMLLSQDQEWYDETSNSPLLFSKILVGNINDMRNMIDSLTEELFVAFVMMLVGMIWALITGWRLAIILTAVSPILIITSKVFSYLYVKTEKDCQDCSIATTSVLHQTTLNLDAIRGLSVMPYFREKYKALLKDYWNSTKRKAIYTSLGYSVTCSLLYFVRSLLFYAAAQFISKNYYSVEQTIQILSLATFTMVSASSCIMSLPNVSASRIEASRILRLADMKPGKLNDQGNMKFPFVGKINFDKVTFAYNQERGDSALSDASFSIKPKEKVAIVGGSGSGKSTTAELLQKVYMSENIYIDGYPLSEIDTRWLRRKMAVVDQKPHLMGETILESLLYGCDANMVMIEEALKQADILETLQNLPNYLESPISEFSKNLSGGQAQRLAIARALLRKPRLLILDECTSALDSDSSKKIEQTIQSLTCTVLIITHQTSLMRLADRIVVMDSGKVMETGSYDELMTPHTHFWKLVHNGKWTD